MPFQTLAGRGCWIRFGLDGLGIEQRELTDGRNRLLASGKTLSTLGVELVELGADMVAGESGSHTTSSLDGLELGPTGILQLLGECLDIEGATSWIISATNIRLFGENDAGVASDTTREVALR